MHSRLTATTWSAARIALLRKLWPTDLSMSQIAECITHLPGPRVSKSAVSGKRLRLGMPDKPIPVIPGPQRASPREQKPKAAAPVPPKATEPPKRAKQPAVDHTPLRIHPHELTAATCRFPIGDPRSINFRYCGCETARIDDAHRTYCDYHHALTHTRPRPPEPRQSSKLTEYTRKLNFAV